MPNLKRLCCLLVGSVAVAACSGTSTSTNSTGGTIGVDGGSSNGGRTNEGSASGGSATGGNAAGGSNATGGMEAGGSTSGGSATGGNANGGSATGGKAAGGSATGGRATGGNANGGSATGGTSATGGKAAGGSATGGRPTGGSSATGGKAAGGSATGGRASGGNGATGGMVAGGSATGGRATGGNDNGGSSANGGTNNCGNIKGALFPSSSIWNTPIDSAALDAESTTVIDYLQTNHTGNAKFQIDFSIKVLTADASTPRHSFTPTGDFADPDCDPAPIPMPAGGSIEGESGYACAGDGDCHLLVIDTSTCRLHEMWRTNFVGTNYQGGCQVIWDLTKVYPANMRGDYCTSADAAGLPIAAHLFSADEVQAGSIDHAIRFILPNTLMRANLYVHPATHSTNSTSGPASAPPYGSRMRLKASKDISALSAGAQIVAKALKKYGMILSDGGNVTFTATADDYTTAKWSQVGLTAQGLKSLQWTDFEMVDGGQRINWHAGDCPHVPITQ